MQEVDADITLALMNEVKFNFSYMIVIMTTFALMDIAILHDSNVKDVVFSFIWESKSEI